MNENEPASLREKERTSEGIRRASTRYRALLDGSLDGFWMVDFEGRVLEVNEAYCRMSGYRAEELLRMRISDLDASQSPEEVGARIQRIIEAGADRFEAVHRRKDGSLFEVEAAVTHLQQDQRLLCFFRDISDRKRAEARLASTAADLDRLVRALPDIYFRIGADGTILNYRSQKVEDLYIPPETFLGKAVREVLPPEVSAEFERSLEELRGGKASASMTYEIPVPAGPKHWEARLLPSGDSEFLVVVRDVTERERAVAALRKSERCLRESQRASQIGSYLIDVSSGRWSSSDVLDDILGIGPDYPRDVAGWRALTHPDLREEMSRYFQQEVLIRRRPFDRQYQILRPSDGQVRWVHGRGRLLLDGSGRPVEMAGTIQDITERRQAGEALKRSERLLRESQRASRIVSYLLDVASGTWTASDALEEVFGIGPTYPRSLAGWIALIHPDCREETAKHFWREVFKQHHPLDHQYRVVLPPDGQVRWVHHLGRLLLDEAGQPVEVAGTIQDITERKRVELALVASEEKYHTFVSKFPGIAFGLEVPSIKLRLLEGNIEGVTGYPPSFFSIPLKYLSILDPRDRPEVEQGLRRLSVEPGLTQRMCYRITHASGAVRWVRGYAMSLGDGSGSVYSIQGALLDVTAELEAEAERRRLLEKHESLVQTVDGIIWEMDDLARLHCSFVSPQVQRILGYTAAEWLAQPCTFWRDHLHPEDRESVLSCYAAKTAALDDNVFEYRMLARDGRTVWLRDHVTVLAKADRPTALRGILVDVTAAREAEQRAAAARHLMDQILAAVGDGVLGVDREGRITFVNPGGLSLLQTDRESLLGRPAHGTLCHEDLFGQPVPEKECLIHRTLATGQPQSAFAEVFRMGQGPRLPLDLTSAPIVEGGEIVGAALSFKDIGIRLAMERELRESRERYRSLVETTADWIWEVDEEARYTYTSPQVESIMGYRVEEVLGQTPFDLVPEAEAKSARARFKRLAAKRTPFSFWEEWTHHREGREVVLELSGVPRFDAEGTFRGYIGIARDITARKAAESERARLVTAIESAAEAVVVTDARGTILYANPAFERATGYDLAEVLGKNPRILKSGEHDEAHYRGMWETISAGKVWVGEFVNQKKSGARYREEATISPILGTGGQITGFVAVKRDVTEERALREKLARADELQRMGRLVGGVAHEVRNPLNAIQATVEALELDLGEDPEHGPLFAVIRSQVDRMSALMRDLLSLGKPLLPERLAPCDLDALCAEASRAWGQSSPARASGISLHLAGAGATVFGEEEKLQQVVVNLLENAHQNSPAGAPIHLRVSREGDRARVAVIDRGQGLRAEHASKVFEPFFTTRKGGTGLGLALVRHIVTQHGGEVSLTNNPGEAGCTAEFVLPLLEPSGEGTRGQGGQG